MNPPQVAFHFDFSCPYAYLASTAIEGLVGRCGAGLSVRPFLLGGVFRARNVAQNLASTLSPAKARHNLEDMQRSAKQFGVPLVMPTGHPIRTVEALRVLLVHNRDAAEGDRDAEQAGLAMLPLMHRIYRAYWVDGLNISQEAVLADLLKELGLDASRLLAEASEPWAKAELRARTDEAIDLGIFGAPAMVVCGTGPFGSDPEGPALFWGQDRLGFVERALGGTPDESPAGTAGPPVDVWFDYSSPFSYLGATRAKRFLGDRVRWRPMLLGALFRELGGPDVPLATFNSAKQAWIAADLRWQAAEAGVALNWPSRFPVRTVLALRVTLLALEQDSVAAEQLIGLLYRSVWVLNEDPADPKVVLACCEEAGLDGASLLERAGQPAGKQALFTATAAALGAGVFGAPTFVVDPDGELPGLFWGNDRLPLAAANC